MDSLLAALIGGGPATVDVTVNGKPLSSLITELAAALRSHQEQINELRDYTYKTDEQMWNRISNLEDGVTKINKDLGFEQRGPQGMQAKSTYDAITSLEKNVTTLDSKRKGTAAAAALERNNTRLLRDRFHAWLNLSNRSQRIRELTAANALIVRRRLFAKWQAAVRLAKRRRALLKGCEVLQRFNENRLAHRCYSAWERYREMSLRVRADRHVALVRAVDAMAAVSLRGFLRRKWLQWLQMVARRRLRDDQQRAALRMAAVTSRSLVRRYFTLWVNLEGQHNLRRRQIRTATALAVQSARILAGRAFSKWVNAGRLKKQRRMGAALVPRLAHDQSVKLASRYYLKLWRFSMAQRDSRSRGHLEEMTKELQRRFDSLSGQVAGTMDKTQQTVTQLQKLSQQQLELEKKQQQQGGGAGGAGLRVSTPVRRNSPTTGRSGSTQLLQQQQPEQLPSLSQLMSQPENSRNSNIASQLLNAQSGVKDPSSSAMQLGTHVSQMNMRGGGSGEVSRVNSNNNVNSSAAVRSTLSTSRPPPQQQQQFGVGGGGGALPQQWLESPQAAWEQIRSRLEKR